MLASPDAHNDFVSRIDGRLGTKVKGLIRIIKAWKYQRQVPISSFYLEMRVAAYAQEETTIEYGYDVRAVLNQLLSCNLAAMRDPLGISGLIQPCKTDRLKAEVRQKLRMAATRADKAMMAHDNGKDGQAFIIWNNLFGGRFPPFTRR